LTLISKIEAEMLADGASLNLCRYSDEPFNTNEIIWPHWGMIPFHPPTAMMSVAAFAALGVVLWRAWPRRSASRLRAGTSAEARSVANGFWIVQRKTPRVARGVSDIES
jgi:hypothetical protein